MIVGGIFGNLDLGIIIVALFLIIVLLFCYCVYLNLQIKRMLVKYDRFMKGKNAKNLEEALMKSIEKTNSLIRLNKIKDEKLNELEKRTKDTYQKVGIVKYDAFKEMGGKLSFVLALLNHENNGFILNVMHSREGCYTYVKEIIDGKSYSTLGEEEKEALEKALNTEEELMMSQTSQPDEKLVIDLSTKAGEENE